MLLDLGKIIAQPGGQLPFSAEMDFSQMDFGGHHPASDPIYVTGAVRNEAGVLVLTATMETVLHCICDRCATPFDQNFRQEIEAILVRELMHEENEDDWTFLLKDDTADLDEIITTAFVLNMESKFLCSPDCKGLCASCGKNLNEGPCDCKPEPDPRLAVLGQLLKDKM